MHKPKASTSWNDKGHAQIQVTMTTVEATRTTTAYDNYDAIRQPPTARAQENLFGQRKYTIPQYYMLCSSPSQMWNSNTECAQELLSNTKRICSDTTNAKTNSSSNVNQH